MRPSQFLTDKKFAVLFFILLLNISNSQKCTADNPLLADLTALISAIFSANNSGNSTDLFLTDRQPNDLQNSSQKCTTSGCIQAATYIQSHLDRSVHPCDNFYKFACGKYIKTRKIPDGVQEINMFAAVQTSVNEQIRAILSESFHANETKSFRLAKTFYASCLNETSIEMNAIRQLTNMLKEFGGWPVLEGDNWHEIHWVEIIKMFRRTGIDVSTIFSLVVATDERNSTKRVLVIDQIDRELNRELFKDRKVRSKYLDVMAASVIIFNPSYLGRIQAYKDMREVLKFEQKLIEISIRPGDRRNRTTLYNPFTIKELQESYPYINWLEYINAFLPTALNVTDHEIVINQAPQYFTQLNETLSSFSNRTIANYLLWRAVVKTGLLNAKIQRLLRLKTGPPRWKVCVQLTTEKFRIPVGVMYVRRYFNQKTSEAAIKLVGDIRSELFNILYTVSWMDAQTREKAIQKANSSRIDVGYQTGIEKGLLVLEDEYKNFEMERDQFFTNTLRLNKVAFDAAFNLLRKPVNKSDSYLILSNPVQVNAFYYHIDNAIVLSAAFFQKPFFSMDWPNYVNYAKIGSIIGHEITHGFDDKGRQFDANGNVINWWHPDAEQQFVEKAKCIIEQYNNYTDVQTNLTLNGLATQGENIADNAGVKEAYYAYKTWVRRNNPEAVLPKLMYNQQQLFWISFAQSWCSSTRNNYMKLTIKSKGHAPNEFRVNGAIINMPDSTFANDFQCPTGSKMNPPSSVKCAVW